MNVPPMANTNSRTPATITARAARLLQLEWCVPLVKLANTAAVSIGPMLTKSVTNTDQS